MSLVEIKGFNPLINNKLFFEQPLKNKGKAYEDFIEISRNVDHTARNVFISSKIIIKLSALIYQDKQI